MKIKLHEEEYRDITEVSYGEKKMLTAWTQQAVDITILHGVKKNAKLEESKSRGRMKQIQ